MADLAQGSFAGGEVSPALQGRRDLPQVVHGMAEITNWFVARTGALLTRSGTIIVDELPTNDANTRLLRVRFGPDDSVVIALMPGLLRLYTMGGIILTGAADAWVNATAYVPGDVKTQGGDFYYCLATHTSATGVNEPTTVGQDTQHWFPLTALGASAILDIPSPYATGDLALVSVSGAGDRLTFTRYGYPVYALTRWSPTRWTMLPAAFRPSIDRPISLVKVLGGNGTGAITYLVTAVQKDTLYESAPATLATATSIGTINVAAAADPTSPVVIDDVAHGLASGTVIGGIAVTPVGAASANEAAVLALMGRNWTVEKITVDQFSLVGSEGVLTLPAVGPASWPPMKIQWNQIELKITFQAPIITDVASWILITWAPVADAEEYRIYRSDNFGEFGLIAKSKYITWTDFGQSSPDTTLGPPSYRLPFRYNHCPAVSTYWEQRQVFAGFVDDPLGVVMSGVGDFLNFAIRFPLAQSDSIAISIPLAESHAIVGLDVIGGLIVRTTGPVVRLTGAGGIVAPDTIGVEVSASMGSAPVSAVLADGLLVYVHRLAGKLIGARWEYEAGGPGGYVGADLTRAAAHLFDGYTFTALEWLEHPEPLLLARRSDGVVLVGTIDAAQGLIAWARFTSPVGAGVIQDVVAVPEEGQDLAYLLVRRTVDGTPRLQLERMAPRTAGYAGDDPSLSVKTDASVVAGPATDVAAGHITITAAFAWLTGQECDLSGPASVIASAADEGRSFRLSDVAGEWQDVQITTFTAPGLATGHLGPTTGVGGVTPITLQNAVPDTTIELLRKVSGLDHLEGESVTGLMDNMVTGLAVVSGGVADFGPYSNSLYGLYTGFLAGVIGLPVSKRARMLRPDWISSRGVVSDTLKALTSATLDVGSTRGLLVGIDEATLAPVETNETIDEPTTLLDGLVRARWTGRWSREHSVILAVDDPVHAAIFGIVLETEVGGR